jgi:hypothetical protein
MLGGLDTASTSGGGGNDAIWKSFGIFFPRAVNDLDPFFRRIVKCALTKFAKHSTVYIGRIGGLRTQGSSQTASSL